MAGNSDTLVSPLLVSIVLNLILNLNLRGRQSDRVRRPGGRRPPTPGDQREERRDSVLLWAPGTVVITSVNTNCFLLP